MDKQPNLGSYHLPSSANYPCLQRYDMRNEILRQLEEAKNFSQVIEPTQARTSNRQKKCPVQLTFVLYFR